jgi:hypothetical protein
MTNQQSAFRNRVEKLPRPVQIFIISVLWVFIVFPMFLVFACIAWISRTMHDCGEWLCDKGFDDRKWLSEWWKLRKQI